jgi:hypothetical protein
MASRVKDNAATVSMECFLPGGSRWTAVPVDVPAPGILYGSRGNEGIYLLPQVVAPGRNLVLMYSSTLTRLIAGDDAGTIVPVSSEEPKPRTKTKRIEAHADAEDE